MKTKVIALGLKVESSNETSVNEIITVSNNTGIHARPATMICQAAVKYSSTTIVFVKDGMEVDTRNPLSLMTFGAEKGAQLEVITEGPQAREAFNEIKALFDDKFGEGE